MDRKISSTRITEDGLLSEFGEDEVEEARQRIMLAAARISLGRDGLATQAAQRRARQARRWDAFDRLLSISTRGDKLATALLKTHVPMTAYRTCSCMTYGCEVREEIAKFFGVRVPDHIV